MLHVQREAGQTGAEFEAGENDLVERDRGKAGERDRQRVMVEQGDAEQRQSEQNEIDRNAQQQNRLNHAPFPLRLTASMPSSLIPKPLLACAIAGGQRDKVRSVTAP